MIDHFKTAAHVFNVSEKMNLTICQVFEDSGIWELPQDEVDKLAMVMSESDVQWVVDELMRSSEQYNKWAQEADGDIWHKSFLSSSHAMAERAAMWAISKPLSSE